MELRPFAATDAVTISGWASTTADVEAWCSLETAPVPPAMIEGWSTDADVEAFVIVDDGIPLGYGEIWIDDAETEVELAHLIVDPTHRGNQVGRKLVAALVQVARGHHDDVVLRVRSENIIAQRCYHQAGFVRASAAEEAEWNDGQPHAYVWMSAQALPSQADFHRSS